MIRPESTIRAIALEEPTTIRVFERFRLDYCCGGNRPLAEACAEQGIAVDEIVASLEQAIAAKPEQKEDLAAAPLAEVIRHIVETHHAYIRNEIPRLQFMARKVAGKHGPNHPGALVIERNFEQLSEELLSHLMKEEQILFPYIVGLEKSREGAEPPHSCFGTVQSPIRMMIMEHEGAAALLEEMRKATDGFTPWEGACPTSTGLYHGMADFERDLHRHVHLENNLLFPRAVALENEILAVH